MAWKNSVERTLEPLVYGWIDAARAVWTGDKPFDLLDPKDRTEIVDPVPWTKLAQKVALIPIGKKGGIKEWLCRLAYFLSPAVSGVSPEVVKAFVKQDRLRTEWEQSADLIRGYHQEIIDFFKGKKVDTLVGRLEGAVKGHLDVLFPKGNHPFSPTSGRTSGKGAHEDSSKRTSRRPPSKQRGRSTR
ncbi:MAG: hypothetical protein ACREYC_15230 [Gammaproteobacteria bacterium]